MTLENKLSEALKALSPEEIRELHNLVPDIRIQCAWCEGTGDGRHYPETRSSPEEWAECAWCEGTGILADVVGEPNWLLISIGESLAEWFDARRDTL